MNFKISTLKDLNKVLLFVLDLSNGSIDPTKRDILHAVSSIGYGEKKGHIDTLNFLVSYNFLSNDKDKFKLTKNGKRFLNLNKEAYIEISSSQKKFLIDLFLCNDSIRKILISIFNKYDFSNDAEKILIDFKNTFFSSEETDILNLFKWLNFFKYEHDLYTSKISNIKSVIRKVKQLQLSDLLKIIKAQQQYGKKAEELALRFEKDRLLKMEHKEQSELVKIVSESNVLLGYDLKSFSGENRLLDYDRYIEVKCSTGNKVRFFWTINEINVAKKLRTKYCIYFYPDIAESKLNNPTIINDPMTVFKNPKFKVLPTEFVVEEY